MSIIRPDLVNFLRSSLSLKDALIEKDPAYTFRDEDLQDILMYAGNTIAPAYTLLTLPKEKEYPLLLIARKEVYWRLATSTAPFYPLSVEGVSISKNARFDHYLSLIQMVQTEYDAYVSSGKDTVLGEINADGSSANVGEILIHSRHFTKRNFELYNPQILGLKADRVTDSLVELSWNKFNPSRGVFLCYNLYLSTSPIVDEYSQEKVSVTYLIESIKNIHATKYRIRELSPSTLYYVALEAKDENQLSGFSEISFTTLALAGGII